MALLDVNSLSIIHLASSKKIVRDISFSVDKSEIIGIVGESGSGKSLTALSIVGLLPEGLSQEGSIIFKGIDLLDNYKKKDPNKVRGTQIGMIFQDPMTSLNPVMRVESQYDLLLKSHNLDTKKYKVILREVLHKIAIHDVERVLKSFPHQLSGGMIQRVVIGFILSLKPSLIIADEITTSLDVTVQKELSTIIKMVAKEEGISIIFITHDLSLAREVADRIIVMYAGDIVEEGDTESIYSNPLHPYTRGLISSVPNVNERKDKLGYIDGRVLHFSKYERGCVFYERCNIAEKGLCDIERPILLNKSTKVRCFKT